MLAHVSNMKLSDYISFLSRYVTLLPETLFWSLGGLMFLLSPAVALAFLHRPAVQGLSLSIFAFTVLMRVTPLTIIVVYLTADEIFTSPIRNFIFFLYILFGAAIFVIYRSLLPMQPHLLRWGELSRDFHRVGHVSASAGRTPAAKIADFVLLATMAALAAVEIKAIRDIVLNARARLVPVLLRPLLIYPTPRLDTLDLSCRPIGVHHCKTDAQPISRRRSSVGNDQAPAGLLHQFRSITLRLRYPSRRACRPLLRHRRTPRAICPKRPCGNCRLADLCSAVAAA